MACHSGVFIIAHFATVHYSTISACSLQKKALSSWIVKQNYCKDLTLSRTSGIVFLANLLFTNSIIESIDSSPL